MHKLDLQPLASRRKNPKLIYMYKVVEGLVPAINPDKYLKKSKPKRRIKAKKFEGYLSNNPVENSLKNNSKSFEIPSSKTNEFKNSFFVKTVLNWNHLDEVTVSAPTVESFKSALTKCQ